jgi:hypothetical protein
MECLIRKGSCWSSLLVSVSLFAPGSVAFAADNGFYVGLASSDVSSDYAASSISASGADDDRGLKAIVGFRPLDSFAIEANYVDMGETRVPISFTPSTLSIESEAISVSAVGLIRCLLVDLYGRLGVTHWESEASLFEHRRRSRGPIRPTAPVLRCAWQLALRRSGSARFRRRLGPRVDRVHLRSCRSRLRSANT